VTILRDSAVQRTVWAAVLIVAIAVSWSAGAPDGPLVIDVWPGKVPPGDNAAAIGKEKFFEAPPTKSAPDKPYRVAGKPCMLFTNVTQPTLTIYRPAKDKDTGVAMLIFPGGGYHALYWNIHGTEVAEWLNSIGVTGIVLKYRCPRRPGEDKTEPAPGPLKDAQRAVSLVRSKAKDWGIDANRIGMVGFSAGGHLAGATATNFDKRAYEAIDDIDQVSCRPDFAVMVYPGYLKLKNKEELAPVVRVPAQTPPIMLVVAGDDPNIGTPEGCALFYLALRRAGVPAELHAFTVGGHPFGVRKQKLPSDIWTESCIAWLRNQGILRANTETK
jgi:acetyl esterase/lipase